MQRRSGFSMVELAIVLIIIGLLVAAVSAGTKIINQAKLRQVLSEAAEIRNATSTYEASYGQLPGDHNRAASFFSGAINGDGNGTIRWIVDGLYESFNAYDHLIKAKLLQKSALSTSEANDISGVDDQNFTTFKSRFAEDSCFHAMITASYTGAMNGTYTGAGAQNNEDMDYPVTVLGADVSENNCSSPLFTAKEQKFLDSKMDDGNPHTGATRVRITSGISSNDQSTSCSTTSGVSASYNLDGTGRACALMFKAN